MPHAAGSPSSAQPPAEPRPGFAAVGRVLGAWSVHGALKIEPLTDLADRFAPGASLWLSGAERRVERSHWRRGVVIVKLHGLDAPEAAQALRGALAEIPETLLRELGEDEYYQHDLIGLLVATEAGDDLGRVTHLLPTGANDVLVVEGSRGEYLLPLIEDVVRQVDLEAGRITVELIEGLEPRALHAPKRSGSTKPRRS